MANIVDSRSWWRERRRGFGTGEMVGQQSQRTGWSQIARNGELVYLTHPMTVYYAATFSQAYSRELPAGAVRCTPENFGIPSNFSGAWRSAGCSVRSGDLASVLEVKPALAEKKADENQGFRVDTSGHVYYGAGFETLNLSWMGQNRWIRQFVSPGSFVCNNQNFGPDPAFGTAKQCWFVPAPGEDVVEAGAPITYYDELAAQYETMQRAEAAAQAQRDMVAAQDRVFADRQAADYAAQQAQIAQNAEAQAAAALAAAEEYRRIQEETQRQAAEYAAEIAALVAASAGDRDAAIAAAQVAAEAEAVRQALAAARAHEAEQRAAYDAAFAATQVEMRNQEQANARLDAAENAAEQAAANAAAGGAVGAAISSDLLLYGGLAALAAMLILVD